MSTTIQISEQNKKRLLILIAEMQNKSQKKLSYDDAMTFLLDSIQNKFTFRKNFSKNYRGTLNREQAFKDLKESREIERK
jgi:hypothetical protein